MTITRIHTAGAETANLDEITGTVTYISGTFAADPADKMSGNYSYRFATGSLSMKYGYISFSCSNRMRIGAWLRMTELITAPAPVFRVMGSGGAEIFTLELSTGAVGAGLDVLGTIRDTNDYQTGWNHYTFELKVHSTSGWVYVRRNGLPFLSWEGNTGTQNPGQLRMGKIWQANYGHDGYIDDIYIDDLDGETDPTIPPILYFRPMWPNAVGDYSQWTPTSGSNFENVDEYPINESDYVQAESIGLKDSYHMTTQTLDVDEECKAIIPCVQALRGGSTEKLKLGTKVGANEQQSSDKDINAGAYTILWERFTTSGSGAWTQSDLDDLQLFIESGGTFI